jgi:hypothetical protein
MSRRTTTADGSRVCSKCRVPKPATREFFYFVRYGPRLSSWCIPCTKAAATTKREASRPPADPLKLMCHAYTTAPRGSEQEATARRELLAFMDVARMLLESA